MFYSYHKMNRSCCFYVDKYMSPCYYKNISSIIEKGERYGQSHRKYACAKRHADYGRYDRDGHPQQDAPAQQGSAGSAPWGSDDRVERIYAKRSDGVYRGRFYHFRDRGITWENQHTSLRG